MPGASWPWLTEQMGGLLDALLGWLDGDGETGAVGWSPESIPGEDRGAPGASVVAAVAALGALREELLRRLAEGEHEAEREGRFEALVRLPAQTLITGTDAETFLPLAGHAEALRTGEGVLVPDPRFPIPELAAGAAAPPVTRTL